LIRSGVSGLPYYCTPPATVHDVIEVLAVCRQNDQKKDVQRVALRVVLGDCVPLVGPQEELRGPSGYTPRGFTSSPKQEAR